MREKTLIVVVLAIVLNLSLVTASIRDITVTDMLASDRSVFEIINISDIAGEAFPMKLPADATAVNVTGPYNMTNDTQEILVNCTRCNLTISYRLADAAKSENNRTLSFSKTLNFPSVPDRLDFYVLLPAGYAVDSQVTDLQPSLVPPPSSLTTDGKTIIIRWTEKDPELPKQYFVRYHENIGLDAAIATSIIYLFLGIIIGVAATIGFRWYYEKVGILKKPGHKVVIPHTILTPDEKIVLALLKENNNVMNQREIVRELRWSKSKVSQILSNLDYKVIVKRVKFGRNHRVELVKDIDGLGES
jgi:uncharacterized membrane protein